MARPLPTCFNFVVADENDLIVEHGAGLRINQPAGLDRGHLGSRARGTRQRQPQQQCESLLHVLHLSL